MSQDHETVARLEALRPALLEAFDAGRAQGGDEGVAHEHGALPSQPWEVAFDELFAPHLATIYPAIHSLSARLAEAEAREAGLRAALKPFADVGGHIKQAAGSDTRWIEAILFYCGDVNDPQKWSLSGRAFDRARAALAGDAQ